MKKLIMVLLAVLLLCGTACAEDLSDLWEYYSDSGDYFYEYTNDGFYKTDPTSSYLDNVRIGSAADWFIMYHADRRSATAFLDGVFCYQYYNDWIPYEIGDYIKEGDAILTQSELHAWKGKYGNTAIREEYYRFDVEIKGPYSYEWYDIIIRFYSEENGGESIDYLIVDDDNYSTSRRRPGGNPPNYGNSSSNSNYGGSTNTGRGKSMYIVNCSKATMYEKPYYWADSIGSIPYGKTLDDITYNGGGFAYGCYNGRYGHVMVEYLSDKNPNVSQVTEEQKSNKGQGKTMVVVNCQEWVSLREKPYYWADRLKKVPLGAYFTDITYNGGGFAYGCYDGTYGYIMVEYLRDIR